MTSPVTKATEPVVITVVPAQKQTVKVRPNALHKLQLPPGPPEQAVGLKKGKNLLLRFADQGELLLEDFFDPPSGQAQLELVSQSGEPLLLQPNSVGIALANGQELVFVYGDRSTLGAWLDEEPGFNAALQGVFGSAAAQEWAGWIAPSGEAGGLVAVAPLAFGPIAGGVGAGAGAGALAAAAAGGGGLNTWQARFTATELPLEADKNIAQGAIAFEASVQDNAGNATGNYGGDATVDTVAETLSITSSVPTELNLRELTSWVFTVGGDVAEDGTITVSWKDANGNVLLSQTTPLKSSTFQKATGSTSVICWRVFPPGSDLSKWVSLATDAANNKAVLTIDIDGAGTGTAGHLINLQSIDLSAYSVSRLVTDGVIF